MTSQHKPRLLDLFCGAGGAAMGYHRAGFEVVGVDIAAQPHYPFEFVQADALYVLAQLQRRRLRMGRFDAVHASPPCQAYSKAQKLRGNEHPELIAPVRELLLATGLPYVIENVPGAPLIEPLRLCGSSFGLGVRRHRLFETNFPIMAPPCAHGQQDGKFEVYEHGRWYESPVAKVYGSGGGKAMDRWAEAMQIDWMKHAEMAQAIPPAFAAHVGTFLIAEVERRSREAVSCV